MLKYIDTKVTFQEIPDEISLCVNISGCPIRCPDCHSKHLWEDTGELLDFDNIDNLICNNKGITCICFMGGDSDHKYLYSVVSYIRENYPTIKIGWYSGNDLFPKDIPLQKFDYVKIGSYKKEKGGLNSINTNQRMYKITIDNGILSAENITNKFRKNEYEN